MRSSISNFERAVPRGAWPAAGVVALVIFVVAMAVWEVRVRSAGYAPALNESSDLWALARSRVTDDPDQTVVVGSSRIQFDFDLATWVAYTGGPMPVQLAIPGTNPVGLLEDVAASEFRGNLILGVAPGLWFVPQGPPVEHAIKAVGRYHNWSPSQKVGLRLGIFLQRRLALINHEDLTFAALLGRIHLAEREGVVPNLPPVLPPYFAAPDAHRQARMWSKCDFGSPLALRIQQRWLPLFTPPPPPPHLSPEEFQGMLAANSAATLERVRVAVEAVRSRGGRVVFVRPPSVGPLRELERKFSPRAAFWDRLLAVTGAPGIHFEDYPELAGFDCPEWSHLTAADAVRFSEAVTPLLAAALAGQGL
jgi:hypothetical protein